MNTIYVLVVLTGTAYGGHVMSSVEFGSQAACETARTTLMAAQPESWKQHGLAAWCFKKTEP